MDMVDRLRGRDWAVWCRQLARIGETIDRFISGPPEHRQLRRSEEEMLSNLLTDVTNRWISLKDQLNERLDDGIKEPGLRELKEEAARRRIDSMGVASRVRSSKAGGIFFQPVYETLKEMVDVQVSVLDSLLNFSEVGLEHIPEGPDAAASEYFNSLLESTVQYLEYGSSLGEYALSRLPQLSREKAEIENKRQKRAAWGCLLFLIVAGLVVAVYFLVIRG